MDPKQEQTLIQLLLASGGPIGAIFISHGMTPGELQEWTTLAVAVIPPLVAFVWGLVTNTQRAQILNVAAMPGFDKLVTNNQANDTVKEMSNDPAIPKVVPPK